MSEDGCLRTAEWQDRFDGAWPETPELFEEENWYPENHGLVTRLEQVGFLEPVKVTCSCVPISITATNVALGNNTSFLRIIAVVHQSMLERESITTELHKVFRTLRTARESRSCQGETVGLTSGF